MIRSTAHTRSSPAQPSTPTRPSTAEPRRPSAPLDVLEAGAKKKPDPRVKAFATKVKRLVDTRFKGDLKRAFAHYDKNKDGGVDHSEMWKFLGDARVGNFITRGFWINGIMKRLDTNKDKKIAFSEMQAALPKKK